MTINELTLVKHLQNINSPFLPSIKNIFDQVKEILNTRIPTVFPHYTLHNTDHSFRVMEHMVRVVKDYKKLTELDIVLLVYSAILHDVGMGVCQDDIDKIKTDTFEYCDEKFSVMKQFFDGDEVLALQEYVRRIHASLSKRYIAKMLSDKLIIPNLSAIDFTRELGLICESHNKDYDWIKRNLSSYEVKGDYQCNPQFIAAILRLSDILDIDTNRTPPALYHSISPRDKSDEEWRQHFIISNTDKISEDYITKQKKIVFYGRCKNANIHRKILDYIDWVKDELLGAIELTNGFKSEYNLFFNTTPEVRIQPEGYTFSDFKMVLQFKAVTSLLMGEKIYGSKSLGLRELIQNSIDACKIRKEMEDEVSAFGSDSYVAKIDILLDQTHNSVIIRDNGIGMTFNIIKNHFLNIGVSYYKSFEFILKDFKYRPIGNFGIGFLSCFMLSNNVIVKTRNSFSKDKYTIELEKGAEWTSLTVEEDLSFQGTEVILDYKSFMEEFEQVLGVEKFLRKYFLTDGINLKLIDVDKEIIASIDNKLIRGKAEEKGSFDIDLSDYLNEIEGYATIKNKNDFIAHFRDLRFLGTPYLYEPGSKLSKLELGFGLNMDDYIDKYTLKYLAIPIVEDEHSEDFLAGLKFTNNDVDEVIKKMDRELTWISIVANKNLQESLEQQEISVDEPHSDFVDFQTLQELGQADECPTKTFIMTINIFEGEKNKLYLPFDIDDPEKNTFWWRSNKKRELFIRNVLIKDFKFDFKNITSVFDVTTVLVNVISKRVIPDVSRNNVDTSTSESLNYAISKAIHLGALKILPLTTPEQNTLKLFIKKFYPEKSLFEK